MDQAAARSDSGADTSVSAGSRRELVAPFPIKLDPALRFLCFVFWPVDNQPASRTAVHFGFFHRCDVSKRLVASGAGWGWGHLRPPSLESSL